MLYGVAFWFFSTPVSQWTENNGVTVLWPGCAQPCHVYIHTHSRGGFNVLLVFLPSAKVNPLRSLKRSAYRDLLKFSAFSTNEPHSGSAAIPMRPWGKSCIATGDWIEEMWFVRCLASAEPLKPPKQWHQTYLLFIELCNPYLYLTYGITHFPTITYIYCNTWVKITHTRLFFYIFYLQQIKLKQIHMYNLEHEVLTKNKHEQDEWFTEMTGTITYKTNTDQIFRSWKCFGSH